MKNINLEKQIVSLIPSQTMKQVVIEENYKFTDFEYIQLVIKFSSSFKDRINLLNSIKENISDKKLKTYIQKYIKNEEDIYNQFIKEDQEYVYDVIMNSELNYDEERYLCPSFNLIDQVINNYIECYKEYLNKDDLKHIKIIKRKITNWDTSKKIEEPGNIIVHLNEKREILYLYSECEDEEAYFSNNEIKYPTVYKAGDLVYIDKHMNSSLVRQYKDYYHKISDNKIYGIVGFNQNNLGYDNEVDVCYFLNLANEYVHFKAISLDESQSVNFLDSHSHIDYGYIEKANLEDVPPMIKEDYEYAKAKLVEFNIIK